MTDRPSDRAFDLGFSWCNNLQGYLRDARDVARTLTDPQLKRIGVDPSVVTALDDKDDAIVAAKAEIKRALAAAAPDGAQAAGLYVECRECDSCGHAGLNDSSGTMDACHDCNWSGPRPTEDRCPGCDGRDCMGAACPKCDSLYRLVADATLTAPPSQDAEDAARLDFIESKRFDVCPLEGGGFDVYRYREGSNETILVASGATARAAIDAARAARGGG